MKIWDKFFNRDNDSGGTTAEATLDNNAITTITGNCIVGGSNSTGTTANVIHNSNPAFNGSSFTCPMGVVNCSCMNASSNQPYPVWITHQNIFAGNHTMTPEELKELEQLKKDREAETKTLRLNEFKKLTPSFRQAVIDRILWKRFVETSNTQQAAATPREVELQAKAVLHYPLGGITSSHAAYPYIGGTVSFPEQVMLPNDITEDDLIKAHTDACAEEMLTHHTE